MLCVQDKTCKFFQPLSVIFVMEVEDITYFLTKLAKIAVH